MKNIWEEYKFTIIIGVTLLLVAISVFGISKIKKQDANTEEEIAEETNIALGTEETNREEVTPEVEKFYVEVKGAVNTPGVYLVSSGQIINDLISLAGGFKTDAYTDNINLSYALKKEMVIYVYTKAEFKKLNSAPTEIVIPECSCPEYNIDNCTDKGSSIIVPSENGTSSKEDNSSNSTTTQTTVESSKKEEENTSKVININTATISELTTLNGIGEAKAQKIIAYRNEFGPFKSIEEIKNVSGIGDAVYEKIKARLTV